MRTSRRGVAAILPTVALLLLADGASAVNTPTFTITGIIRDAAGQRITLGPGDSAKVSDPANFSVSVQPDGSFVLPNNPPGDTAIDFDAYATAGLAEDALPRIRFHTNTFTLSGDLTLDFRLPSVVVTTTVTDRAGQPVPHRYVFLQPLAAYYEPVDLGHGIFGAINTNYGPAQWDTSSSAYTDVNGVAKARIYPSGSISVISNSADGEPSSDRNGIPALSDTAVSLVLQEPIADEVTAEDESTAEGNFGTKQLVFFPSIPAPAAQPISFHYATRDVSATAGQDYAATSGTATIQAGQTYVAIPVTVMSDTTPEPAESFALDLTNLSVGTFWRSEGFGTISDDDGSGLAEPTVTIVPQGPQTVATPEGTDGRHTVGFSIICRNAAGLAVQWTTVDGTATAGSDYESDHGTYICDNHPAANEFVPGQYFPIHILGDTQPEGPESFTGHITIPQNAPVRVLNDSSRIYVMDDDQETFPTVYANDVDATEGTSAIVHVKLTRPVNDTDVEVTYQASDGTAKAGNGDYTPTSGTLDFAPGETDKTVTIPITSDGMAEGKEDFYLGLGSQSTRVPRAFEPRITIVDAAPTAVALAFFVAHRSSSGTELQWRLASAGNTLGFNVYRQADWRLARVNRNLIFNQPALRLYHVVDGDFRAKRGTVYRLQAIDARGARQWLGLTRSR